MEKYLKRKKIFLKSEQNQSSEPSLQTSEEVDALPLSSNSSTIVTAPVVAAKKPKQEAKKKPAPVRKSSRRSRSSMENIVGEEELMMDTAEVGLTEELIAEMKEETVEAIEETVIEEKFEIPDLGADLLVPSFLEEERMKKKPVSKPKSSPGVSFQQPVEEEDLVSPKLEVTGVSRSGRVRKKSSKLTDFKSPDEIDPRYKRKMEKGAFEAAIIESPVVTPPSRPKKSAKKPTPPAPPPPPQPLQPEELFFKEEVIEEEEVVYPHDTHMESDSDPDMHHTEEVADDDEHLSDDSVEADHHVVHGELDDDDIDDDDDDEEPHLVLDESPRPKQTNQAMSLYMMEKSRKKLVVKDGKIVGRQKAQRKDKGKTRYTAYMLWAKQARKDALKFDPDMDFSTTSKKLGEMWGLVPTSEKLSWRRRAKRLSAKQKLEENRAFAQGQQRKLKNTAPPPQPKPSPAKPKQDRRAQGQLNTLAAAAAVAQQQQLSQQQQLQNALAVAASEVSKSPVKSSPVDTHSATIFKPVSTAPVDVAAHLKLLGESLSNIGERLKEHEGQIAVSGSVSVLLDSLICAMGPLLCLTQQVPEFNVCSQEQLSQTLDYIAYIMPGL